ncbi:MAG: PAS domain S-box protein [Clostridiales bacterium]
MANEIILDNKLQKEKKYLKELNNKIEECIKDGKKVKLEYEKIDFFSDEIKDLVDKVNNLIIMNTEKKDLVASLEDEVMKRKLAEELLKNERDFISTIFDKTALLVVVIDTNFNIINLNRACEQLTEFTLSELKGKNVWDLLIQEFSNSNKTIDEGIFFQKNNLINYWKTKSNTNKIVSWSITAILNEESKTNAYAITGIDINKIEENKIQLKNQAKILSKINLELLENQKKLRKEKDKAQKYLNIAGVIIVALDNRGNITLINKSGCEVLGYKREEIINKNWFDTSVPYRKREKLKEIYSNIIKQKKEDEYLENEIVTKNGEERIIAWRNLLLYDDFGKIIGVLSSGNDITKQKEIDIMKSEIVNTISHEIRTPLGSILGFSELMLKRDLSKDKMKSYLNTINKESIRLMDLINDFLDIQRLENGKLVFNMVEFYVKDIIENLLRIFETRKHKIFIDIKENVKIFADYNKILQILTNLVSNGIKYSPEAESIYIKVERIGDVINFCVEDFGFGINEEYIDKIFNKFYRVEQEKNVKIQGTGLGLAICKEIVSAHGGIIWVESKIGSGSKFYFSIPLART